MNPVFPSAQALLRAGFCPVPFALSALGEGAWRKQMKLQELPSVCSRLLGQRGLQEQDLVYVELIPGHEMQLGADVVGVYEPVVDVHSPAARALLAEAGVATPEGFPA